MPWRAAHVWRPACLRVRIEIWLSRTGQSLTMCQGNCLQEASTYPGGHIERCTSSMKGAGGRECVEMGVWIDVGCGLCACVLAFKDKRERVGSGGSSTYCLYYMQQSMRAGPGCHYLSMPVASKQSAAYQGS